MATVIRILVVETNEIISLGLRFLINCEATMKVVGATADPHDALILAHFWQPDVVLWGTTMPEYLPIIQTIKQQLPESQILVTAPLLDFVQLWQAMKLGMVGYWPKTGNTRALIKTIQLAHKYQ